jgi:hypothetical protein
MQLSEDAAMSAFEGADLQTLNTGIAAARSRLSVARLSKNRALVHTLEEEIAAADKRRSYLRGTVAPDAVGVIQLGPPEAVESIAPDAGGAVEPAGNSEAMESIAPDAVGVIAPAGHPEVMESNPPPNTPAAVEKPRQSEADEAEPSMTSAGVTVVSDQPTAIDVIELANRQLATQRAEMLARHAEELKELEADQLEIDAMAQRMNAFVRKFNLIAIGTSVVQLEDERDIRQQSHG